MQNLTAHYNILFNANELLRQKQESYALAFIDSYGDLLSVYQDTTLQTSKPDKDLDAAIAKANAIINEKEQSHYIADAYVVIGKANYLSGNYFNAVEFFNYVIRSFPKQVKPVQEAYIWKTRSLLYLKNFKEAKLTLDSALLTTDPKKQVPADLYAAKLQYDIDVKNYTDAEEMAKKAVFYCHNKPQKLRWTFILGQLQELNHENEEAIKSYTSITRSNASFEMAFNANLNRIQIQDERNGVKTSRTDRLLSLLKNPNNNDFTDQIYYQVGDIYLLNNDIGNALKYYKLSVRSTKTNQNQKGLSYLRIADIEFKDKADYIRAKKYYDSTLINLSPNYSGYQTIQKKSNNLSLLAEKLQVISREDTLQFLARLDPKTRLARIDAMAADQVRQQQTIAASKAASAPASATNNNNNAQTAIASTPNGSSFYFYNVNAVSRGYADFKRIWGDRKLEDNWRRSNRPNTNATANGTVVAANAGRDALPADKRKSETDIATDNYRQQLLQRLPLTPTALAQSNARIYTAYLDIANFYRDVLDDKKEAIATYSLLLNKFPENSTNKPIIYYNLYRLYSEMDINKSDEYKNKLVKEYPETSFARVIIDPDYARNLDNKDALFNTAYNKVYDLYAQKKYNQVISSVDTLLKQYPDNKLTPQLFYLRAIAAGHQEKLPPFQADLQKIADSYPDDKLITPLVKQHLNYIEANRLELASHNYVLIDNDATEVVFIPPIVFQQQTAYRHNITQEAEPAKSVETKQLPKAEPVKTPPVIVQKSSAPVSPKAAAPRGPVTFSLRDSTNYCFVINVSTGTTDLSSSRFGIGQFNRTNYPPNAIKHQLKNAGPDNQLIYIGRFYNIAEVKKYARAIIPLLPEIMKVPKDKYSFFIITQENLDKLADKKLLDSYYDYYQKTY